MLPFIVLLSTDMPFVGAQEQGAGVLGGFDTILPEQAPETPSTSLIMLFLVSALITGESIFLIYQWFEKRFGDDDKAEQA